MSNLVGFYPNILPDDIIENIFGYLELRHINHVQIASKLWYATALRNRRELIFNYFAGLTDSACDEFLKRVNPKSLLRISFHSCFLITHKSLQILSLFPLLYSLTLHTCLELRKDFLINFPYLPQIKSLYLTYTGIPSQWKNFPNLNHLSITDNLLDGRQTNLTDLELLSQLTHLELPLFSPNEANANIICKLTNLKELSIFRMSNNEGRWNNITNLQCLETLKFTCDSNLIDPQLSTLLYLTKLVINVAPLMGLDHLEKFSLFSRLRELELVDLKYSLGTITPATVLVGNPNGLMISGTDPVLNALAPLAQLTRLKLSGGLPIREQPFFGDLSALPIRQFLLLPNEEIPEFIFYHTQIEQLSGMIHPDHIHFIKNLKYLTRLELYQVKVPNESLITEVLEELSHLVFLVLRNMDQPAKIPLNRLLNLRVLDLNGTAVVDEHLEGIELLQLERLILTKSNITNLTISRIKDMSSLRCLNLNRCSALSPGFLKYFKQLYNLEQIYLNGVEIEEKDLVYLRPFIRKLAATSAKVSESELKKKMDEEKSAKEKQEAKEKLEAEKKKVEKKVEEESTCLIS